MEQERQESDSSSRIRLFIVEEQEVFLEAYRAVLPNEPSLELKGITSDASVESILSIVSALDVDAVLLGIRIVQPDTISQLEIIRERFPGVGLVLFYP